MAVKRTGVLDALAAGPKSADELAKELGALPLPLAVHSPEPCARLQNWRSNLCPYGTSCLAAGNKRLPSMKQGRTALLDPQGSHMRA